MSPEITSRERRLWIAVAVAVAAIFASLYPLQILLNYLRARNQLRLAIALLFLAAAAGAIAWMIRRRAGAREWAVLALSGAAYFLFARSLDVVQERLHLIEYGALALLLREAVGERRRARGLAASPGRVAIAAFTLASAVGLADEVVQGILPNRMYDLRDVGFNALAAAMALATAAALEAVAKER